MDGKKFARVYANYRVSYFAQTGRIVGYCEHWNTILVEPDIGCISWPIETAPNDTVLFCDDVERGYWVDQQHIKVLSSEPRDSSPLPLPG